MHQIVCQTFKSERLQSTQKIDRADLIDASSYLANLAKRIPIDRSEWEYEIGQSLWYTTEDGKWSYHYQIVVVPDRILCAAVHFDKSFAYAGPSGLDREPPRPANIDSGVVVAGRRHGDCWAIYLALTEGDRVRAIEGFLTVANRFVDRAEAFQIAKAAGQLLSHVGLNGDYLISEMLYFD